MRKFLVIFTSLVVLCLAAAIVYTAVIYQPDEQLQGKLEDILLDELPGWEVKDMDLAESEEMQERVAQILNYTQAIYRTYRRGSTEVGVYVGYWAPKTMPVRQVNAHTPDVCWVLNGWSVEDRQFAVAYEAQGDSLRPAEVRQMEKQNHTLYVAYWHVIGDRTYVNRSVNIWNRMQPIQSLFRYGLHQQEAQFFIRISSNRPLDEIWDDAGFQQIIEPLKAMALQLPEPPADAPLAESSVAALN